MQLNAPRHQLRQHLRHIRSNLDIATQQLAAERIAAKIFTSDIFLKSQNVACYLAINGEVDLAPLIQKIWISKKNCYLPLLDPHEKRHLCFVSYNEHDRLVKNKYNILQPDFDEKKIIAPQKLDLVIAPLVGFDIGGDRLGQGCGYYDYTFAFLQQMPRSQPYLLGVAYEWQKVDELAASSWDVKLDAVVTDEAGYVFINS